MARGRGAARSAVPSAHQTAPAMDCGWAGQQGVARHLWKPLVLLVQIVCTEYRRELKQLVLFWKPLAGVQTSTIFFVEFLV